MLTDLEQQALGIRIARIAHWTVNRNAGNTKAQTARELATIARELLSPEEYAEVIGDAAEVAR